ncbi:hypothetical protein ACWGS9_05355 [Bradyrhizobium sp. Arg314]
MIATELAEGWKLWRLLSAIALAPATGPLIYCFGMLLGSGYPYSGAGHMEKHFDIVLALMVLSYPISIGLGALIVGILYFTGRLTGWNCLAWALVIGAAAGFLFSWFVNSSDLETPPSGRLIVAVAFAVVAGLTALVFCLIAGLKIKQPAGAEEMMGRRAP